MTDAAASKSVRLLRIAQVSAVIGGLIAVAGFAYMLKMGIGNSSREFYRLQAASLPFLAIAGIYGTRYRAITWRDRPEKQWRLRILRLLVVLLLGLIPVMVMCGFYS